MKLEKIFPEYQLTNQRTLFECDFYDTHYRFFDEIDDDYLKALNNSSPQDLILKWGFDWPAHYLKIGLQAVESRSRPQENIQSWKDISYEYLFYFSDSCCFLETEGFKFFLPAAIFHYLDLADSTTSLGFMDHFLHRLKYASTKDLSVFDSIQKDFLSEFTKAAF